MQEPTAIAPSTPVTTSTQEQEPTPVAPSTEEQCFYFDGLPSNPKLVARSSSLDIKWGRGNGGTVWGSKKRLYPASPTHPIASLWGGTLRRKIINALDGSGGLDWTAIDIAWIPAGTALMKSLKNIMCFSFLSLPTVQHGNKDTQ
ncbi:unnamed protein product [Clonostachys byssicola]|uniref:Uncharacterized protein n=1 Tax=Clonostachys byssicola TaxID=160290 RepID=A0A9N9Y1U4_9HYPO|nr:unnamed protein product [Clonostachys byssicola]